MAERRHLSGKFVWFELASTDAKRAQAFYADVLGWRTATFPVGGTTYHMIFAGETPDTMIGTCVATRGDGARSRWTASVSVDDVDRAAATAVASGGRVVEAPHDVPTVGRTATIADPQGAEIALFRNATGDPADLSSLPPGRFMWNELHTTDPEAAVAFYEKVVGFSHRAVPSPAGPYHILSSAGVDRGGITSHLPAGTPPHWLPFVRVDDLDEAIERARQRGARIAIEPKKIMDVGRLGVLEDPTGAVLALMKPNPRAHA